MNWPTQAWKPAELSTRETKRDKRKEPQLIGLSATIGSPDKVAKIPCGRRSPSGDSTDIRVKRDSVRDYLPQPEEQDYEIATKLFTHPEVSARLRAIRELIEKHKTTLVFTTPGVQVKF